MENDEEELNIFKFISSDLDVEDFISTLAKKVYLCPHCGKLLSGQTSYQRHLVMFFD